MLGSSSIGSEVVYNALALLLFGQLKATDEQRKTYVIIGSGLVLSLELARHELCLLESIDQ
jgi:hypothetical protein